MEFLNFIEFKKQLQKLYNYKAKEEREILYCCKLQKDPLHLIQNYFTENSTNKKRFSNIFSNQTALANAESPSVNQMISITKSRNSYFLEFLYLSGDNIAFPYSSNLNMMVTLNACIDENNNKINTENSIISNSLLNEINISTKRTLEKSGCSDMNSIYSKSNNNKLDNNENLINIKLSENNKNKNNINYLLKNVGDNYSNLPSKEISNQNISKEESFLNIITIKFSDKTLDLEFFNSLYLREFLWCLNRVIETFFSNANIQMKGFNHKDLEDFAEKKKFNLFNKIFEIEKKKEKYEIDVTDEELETLKHTLNSINITSILENDLENLNSKIEQFNIETKEDFLHSLQGSFGKGVEQIKKGRENLEIKLKEISNNLIIDSEMIDHVWNSIQKIEEANHRIELRWENKRKLEEYMRNLLDQLTISHSKEQTLLKCKYISNSDIIIVSELLDRFLKFFKSRKKQDVKLNILSEGRQKIKLLVDSMIINYFQSLADFIRGNFFMETFLLSELTMFNSNKINLFINKNIEKNKMRRISLTDYLNDRKFFIQKINLLFTKSEMAVDDINFNQKKYFKEAIDIMTESLGDLLNNEIAIWQDCWNSITTSEMNVEIMDLDISCDSLLEYDAFEYFNKDPIYESGKYMACVILNSFLALDNCAENLFNFFSEKPNFYFDKNYDLYHKAENDLGKSILEILSNFFDENIEKCNVLLPLIYYNILASINEKISKNLMEDIIHISFDDIIEIKNMNEEAVLKYNNNNLDSEFHNTEINPRKFNFGFEDFTIGNKISLQITKTFIKSNLKTLNSYLTKFFATQKATIENYKGKPRRIGIIPVIRKGCNFLKLIISLTCQIKQDYIYIETEDFVSKMKVCIEKISKIEPKYTTIILIENFYFINKFLKSFEINLNITNAKITEMQKYCYNIYEKYKNAYIEEVFSYQFGEFWEFYSKICFEFQQQGEKIKNQAAFIFNNFHKKTQTFLKELPKNMDRFAERVHKHFCKEENLSPIVFSELQNFLFKIVTEIDKFYEDCYKTQSPIDLVKNAKDLVMKYNFSKLK